MPEFDEDRIVRRLKAVSDIEPTVEAARRAMERVREALANEGKGATDSRTRLRRIFWRSRLARFAAAAVIIAAAITGLHYLPDGVGFTAPAFSEVIQNMQQEKWIYFFKEDVQEGTIGEQVWASPELQILAGTGTKGWAAFVDCKAKREYNYSPQQGAIEVSYPEEDAGGMYGVYVFSRLGLMDEVIRMHEEEDAYITKEKATYNGRDAIVYRFEVGLSADVAEISNWVVDAETHLPIINEVVRVASGGQVQRSHRFAFDYPDTGPKDIYDLGVPEDVNVIDKTPSEAVEKVLWAYQESSKSTVKRYIAVIKQWDQPRYIEYGDGLRKRVELYELAINGSDWMAKKEFYRKQMGDTFDSVFHWLKNTEVMSRVNIELHDGIFYYRIHAGEMRRGKGPRREREYSLRGVFAQLGWPQMRFEGEVTEDDYSREHGLICINGAYIDPNRDYICTKWGSREVVEFGRTESGHWYPKKVEGAEGTETVYIKENPDFPHDIFSPNSLPNYAEWESNHVEAGFVIRKPRSDSNEAPVYEGFTPLHIAVFTGNMEAAKRLLAGGADVNPRFNSGATPMELAAAGGRLDMVKLLFEHGATFTSPDGGQRCALGAAVLGGNLDILKFMLGNGADVNGSYKEGKAALHYAAEKAASECVRMLLDYGADVEKRDEHGETALLAGAERGRFIQGSRRKECVETARLLLEAGAEVDTAGQEGLTPLSLLCLEVSLGLPGQPNIELIKLLVDNGADVDFHRPGDCTPLINAVIAKNLELAKALLEAGADPFIEEHSLWPSPIAADIAALNGSKEIEELLREYMEPQVSADNKAIRGVITRLLNAVRDGSSDAVKEIDVDCPLHKGMWESRLKTLHHDYEGNYEMFDDILTMRAQNGWAEVIIKRPEADKKQYLSIELMQYPDDSWKVVRWGYSARRLDRNSLLQHPPAQSTRTGLNDYRSAVFKAAGKRMN